MISAHTLEYLITSRARRLLLRLLWVEGRRESVSALARESGLNFSAVHRELEAMKEAGLALAERRGPSLEYRANGEHPHARALHDLLILPSAATLRVSTKRDAELSGEEALVERVIASHQGEAAALVLPSVIWRQRNALDYRRLTQEAIRRNEAHALGFFLQLTGKLGRDLGLVRRAWPLRDGRRKALRPFFSGGRIGARSLPVALRWGYFVDIELARFAAAFRRGTR